MANGANVQTANGAVIVLVECDVCGALLGDSAGQDKHGAWHGQAAESK